MNTKILKKTKTLKVRNGESYDLLINKNGLRINVYTYLNSGAIELRLMDENSILKCVILSIPKPEYIESEINEMLALL